MNSAINLDLTKYVKILSKFQCRKNKRNVLDLLQASNLGNYQSNINTFYLLTLYFCIDIAKDWSSCTVDDKAVGNLP